MKQKSTVWSLTALLLCVQLLTACMAGTRLNTVAVDEAAISGTYTLLLHGCHYPTEVDNVALLVDEQSPYPVDIYDIPSSYRVKKNVPAKDALSEAASFVRCSSYRVSGTRLVRIVDDGGGMIGYEMRPLYLPYEFGAADVLIVSYFLRQDGVRVYIRIDPDVERALESSGDNSSSRDSK